MDKVSFFILNIFLNSLLAFFTAVGLTEGLIFLCRLKPARGVSFLRMIPILKLPLDLCFYNFTTWAYAHGINALQSEEGTRNLTAKLQFNTPSLDALSPIVSSIQGTLPGDLTFTFADLIGYKVDPLFLKIFSGMILLISVGLVIQKVFLYAKSLTSLRSLSKNSPPVSRQIYNSLLSAKIEKHHLPILSPLGSQVSPFATGFNQRALYLPKPLSTQLCQKEYEAVIAHELEHIRSYDTEVRLILNLIRSLFWWIPTRWLQRKVEEAQEMACDLKCQKYGVDPLDLASALSKSANYSSMRLICVTSLTTHSILKRVQRLLQPSSRRVIKTQHAFSYLALAVAFFVVLLGRFWTF